MIPTAIPSPCEEALRGLAAGQDDLRRCIETLTPMLFALARRLHLPEELREAAVGDALSDIRQHCGQWPRTQLPAQVWVLAVAGSYPAARPERPGLLGASHSSRKRERE